MFLFRSVQKLADKLDLWTFLDNSFKWFGVAAFMTACRKPVRKNDQAAKASAAVGSFAGGHDNRATDDLSMGVVLAVKGLDRGMVPAQAQSAVPFPGASASGGKKECGQGSLKTS